MNHRHLWSVQYSCTGHLCLGCPPDGVAGDSFMLRCLSCRVQTVLNHPKLLQLLGINSKPPLSALVDQYMPRARQLLDEGAPHVSRTHLRALLNNTDDKALANSARLATEGFASVCLEFAQGNGQPLIHGYVRCWCVARVLGELLLQSAVG